MATNVLDKPIRAGVFHDVEHAEHAVEQLKQHGFTDEQITVVCSDQAKERHFRAYEHQEPAGFYSLRAVAGGAAIGGILGIIIGIVTAVAADAGVFVLSLAMFCGLAGAVLGGFLGEMMTRGLEKELADFYDQEIQRGDILVAAEDHDQQAAQHLEETEQILEHAGTKPIKLAEG